MSSVFKGIKKVFKKVFKAVKKVLPVVLAVGAIVFTGGAALGLTAATWGGAGGVAASIGSAIGGTGVVGSALSGAIYQAGVGAAIGGTISAASGGSFSKGAKAGAITGAITGGVSGAYGHLKTAAQSGGAMQSAGTQPSGAVTSPLPDAGASQAGVNIDAAGNMTNASAAANMPPVNLQGSPGIGSKIGSKIGGLFNQGGWMERNQDLVGNVVKGIGGGLAAGAEADAERDLLRERHNLTSQNYAGTDPGRGYNGASGSRSGLMPSQRFSADYYGSFEYRYNPETARIERVPVGG